MREKILNTNDLENSLVLQLMNYYETEEYKEQYAKDLFLSINSYYSLPFLYEDKDIEKVDFRVINGKVNYFVYCDVYYIVSHHYIPSDISDSNDKVKNYQLNFIVTTNKNNLKYIIINSYGYIFWNIPLSNLYIYCKDIKQLCNYQALIDNDLECNILSFNKSEMEKLLCNDNHLYDNGYYITTLDFYNINILLTIITENKINLYFDKLTYYGSIMKSITLDIDYDKYVDCNFCDKTAYDAVSEYSLSNHKLYEKLTYYSIFNKTAYEKLDREVYINFFRLYKYYNASFINSIIVCNKNLPNLIKLKLKFLESANKISKVIYI